MKTKTISELNVKFQYGEEGYCYDVFKTGNNLRICRMEGSPGGEKTAGWYTLTPEDEPCAPIKANLPIHVMDKKGKKAVTEQNSKIRGVCYAEKKFPFSWEEPDQDTVEKYNAIYQINN
jgi:hypothetical protein